MWSDVGQNEDNMLFNVRTLNYTLNLFVLSILCYSHTLSCLPSLPNWCQVNFIKMVFSQIKLCRDYALFGRHFWPKFDGRGHENILKDRDVGFPNFCWRTSEPFFKQTASGHLPFQECPRLEDQRLVRKGCPQIPSRIGWLQSDSHVLGPIY